MSNPKLKILLVDDEAELIGAMESFLEKHYEVLKAYCAEDALVLIDAHAPELVCVISDFKMKQMTGMQLRYEMLKKHKDIPFVLLSGFISREDALAGIDAKISSFESKPFDYNRLPDLVKKVASDRESTIQERMMLEHTFIEEASAICEELEPLIMSLESNPTDIENLNTIFRLIHTIKGSSGVLESTHIRTYVHKYEDLLSKLKSSQLLATPEIVSVLLQGFDIVNRMIAHLRSGTHWDEDVEELAKIFDVNTKATAHASQATQNTAATNSNRNSTIESVSVPTSMLDQFMEQSGEITVIRNMVNKLIRVIEKEQPGNKNVQQLSELLDEMHKINGGMQGRLSETRKVPCTKVFKSIPRIVRDTASALGKKVNLSVHGESTRVDTAIAKVLSDSMTHIIRNSLDHGIESPEKRVAKGKAPEGILSISAVEQKDEIIVTISDDGAGLNVDRIKKKALEQKLYKEDELARMPEKSIFKLIFASGFSTAEKVTDVSGRGVGMDMVRSAVEGLKGSIDIESTPDKGAKFQLRLPVPKSVLIINSLSVVAENLSFAIPQDSITRLIRFDEAKSLDLIHQLEGGYAVHFEGDLIPVVDLGEVLNLRPRGSIRYQTMESVNLLIISTMNRYYALFVDKVLDSEEIVVKSAGKHLAKLKVYMGATFMADGNVGLILNTDGIAEVACVSAFNQSTEDKTATAPPPIKSNSQAEHLVFHLFCDGKFSVPLERIHRLEEIRSDAVQTAGDRTVTIYRDQIMPLIDLSNEVAHKPHHTNINDSAFNIFVVLTQKQYVGFIIKSITDIAAVDNDKKYDMSDRPQLCGTLDIGGEVVSMIDLDQIMKANKLMASPKMELVHSMSIKTDSQPSVPPAKQESSKVEEPKSIQATQVKEDNGLFLFEA